MGHVFGSLGSKITVIERGPAMLSRHDTDISQAFTTAFGQQVDLRLNTTVQRVDATADGVRLSLLTPDGPAEVTAAKLLVATGRQPNSDLLNLPAAGIEHRRARARADRPPAADQGARRVGARRPGQPLPAQAHGQRRGPGGVAQHRPPGPAARGPLPGGARGGVLRPAGRLGRRHRAGTDRQRPPVPGRHPAVHSTAYGWALQDTTSFVKVLADPETRLLLGAHLIGPQASILIQPLVQAMCLGSTIDDVATDVLYIHPALTEVVEQALLGLGVEDDTAMPVHIKAAED